MKKSLPLLALLLTACLLLSACKTANKPSTTTTSATTSTTTTTAPITDPLPTEERYTDEMGRYVCKNVATLAKLEQYFVPYNGRLITDSMGDDKIGCMIREKDYQESTVAVVKKIASESYFTAYEDQRTPLAYTYSTLVIVSLPEGGLNYHNLQVGDIITVVEPYAFSPDSPDVIYRSHIIPRFSLQWGIMEFGSEYLVNITSLPSAIQCNETGKEKSETLELPDDCYFLGADLYPVDRKVYDAWMSEAQTAEDLAIPTAYPEWASEWWTIIYQWAYEEYVSNLTSITVQSKNTNPNTEFELSADEIATVVSIWDNGNWEPDITKTGYDYVFVCSGTELRYSSEYGIFNDPDNNRHLELTEDQRIWINSFWE